MIKLLGSPFNNKSEEDNLLHGLEVFLFDFKLEDFIELVHQLVDHCIFLNELIGNMECLGTYEL